MRLTADESEINLANGGTEPEFSEWKWATPEEVIEQVFIQKFSTPIIRIKKRNLINICIHSNRQRTTRGQRTRKL